MPSGTDIIWKDVATYCADAQTYWYTQIGGFTEGNTATAQAKINTELAELSSGYATFKSEMASSGLSKLREWYIIPLFSYCTMLSTMTGYPSNLQIQQKFLGPQYGTSQASGQYDDLRNSVISWNFIGDYMTLFTIAGQTVTNNTIDDRQSEIAAGYLKWDSYMSGFNNAFIQENCSIGIWGSYNPSDTVSIGINRPKWGSSADMKAAVLSSDTFTTGPNNTTIQPMHFGEVMEEVGWDIVGLNDPAT